MKVTFSLTWEPRSLIIAGTIWAGMIALWWAAMPSDLRGKAWHRVLPVLPLAVIGLALILPPSGLRDSLTLYVPAAAGILPVLLVAWAWGTARRNHGVMDICYPAIPVAVAAVILVAGQRPPDETTLVLLALLAIWSVRLIVQTWGHNIHAERQPYAHWRSRFGRRWTWWSLFQVHLLQGVVVWLWCVPLVFALTSPEPIPAMLAAAGAGVWLAGFLLQWTADRQLARFKADPGHRGRLLDTGVWGWVRHPNYLGETIMWSAWFVFALAHPWGALTVFAPLFTGWFMGYASAAPFKEMHMARTRGEAWAAYCARTPRFLPWPRPLQKNRDQEFT